MKRLFAFLIASATFVAVVVLWSWVFLVEPNVAPFPVRAALTLTMFGWTSFAAWSVLKHGVWRPAMVAAMSMSGIAAAICLAAYRFDNIDFLYHAAYLLATWAVALPWAGLLSLARLTGWARRIRQVAVAAVWLLALVPVLGALMVLSGGPDIGGALLLVLLAFSSGVFALIGTVTVTILAVRADRGAEFPELHTALCSLLGSLKDSPLRSLLRGTFDFVSFCFAGYLSLAVFGFAYDTHLVQGLRRGPGPPKRSYGEMPAFFGGGDVRDRIFFASIVVVLLTLIGLTLWVHRWRRPWAGLTLGVITGLSIPALWMLWEFISAFG